MLILEFEWKPIIIFQKQFSKNYATADTSLIAFLYFWKLKVKSWSFCILSAWLDKWSLERNVQIDITLILSSAFHQCASQKSSKLCIATLTLIRINFFVFLNETVLLTVFISTKWQECYHPRLKIFSSVLCLKDSIRQEKPFFLLS